MESPRRWRANWLVVAVLVVGMAASVALGIVVAQHKRDTRADWLEDRGEVVAAKTQHVVQRAIDGATAVASFLEAVPDATQNDFSNFVANIDPSLSLIGTAYLSIVPGSDLDTFVADMRRTMPAYDVNEVNAAGEVIPVTRDRAVYYPVTMLQPGSILDSALAEEAETPLALGLGIDGGSQAPWRPGLQRAANEDTATVSGFVEVGFGDTFVGNSFIVAVPVHDDSGDVSGLVAAPMIDVLLSPDVDRTTATEIDWHIDSGDVPHEHEGAYSTPIELPGTTWGITLEPTARAEKMLAGLPAWLPVAAGVVATFIVAALVRLMVLRVRSRRRLEELARVSAEKDRFLATVSHEIRTPLTAVTAVANELRDRPDEFSHEEATNLLSLMVEQSDEVTAIVEDLLIAGRPETEGVIISPVEMDLMTDVRRAALSVGAEAAIEGSTTTLVSDPKRVRQIVRNLLTNASRYGGPNIGVRVGEHGGRAIVDVVDDGKPIPLERRRRMFEPYTSNHDHAHSTGAMGLGLYISATLANLLGGRLSYDHNGSHSIFRLELPLSTAPVVMPSTGAVAINAATDWP